jgi:hypothetical protein
MPAVIKYMKAANAATPNNNTGVYGSYSVVEAVYASGACSRFWQTYAWSRGNKSAAANMYQYQNDITANGITIDLDESYGEEGRWNTMIQLSVADANKIILFLSAAYLATDSTEAQTEFHRLANELRKVSGQPET